MTLRLVLADDHRVVLHGLEALLSLEPDLTVCALCTDGLEAVEAVELHRPDVLVTDLSMPRCSGLEAHRRLRERGIRIPTIVLAATLGDDTLVECIRASVEGIILKESAASVLVDAIRAVARGDGWIPAPLATRVLRIMGNDQRRRGLELTPRERAVVMRVAGGKSNKHIAAELDIAESTVKLHLRNAYAKLGVSNRVQLTLVARERGVV
ncbi:MAG TPA: response regulator transcription factor [Gemmatimonadaceae bacterium]|nr:response regulator transcription factor [Gemmatimonadaceae bacterium]